MRYSPYAERTPDGQYQDMLRRVRDEGIRVPTRQGPAALTLMQQTMRFDLANGFPVITDRSIGSFWRKPIGELCAFINGATPWTNCAEFGCDWWDAWATEAKTAKRGLPPGELGPGSYGGAFHDFPTAGRRRRASTSSATWWSRSGNCPETAPTSSRRGSRSTRSGAPARRPQATIAPCHGWVHVRVLDGGLHLHMFQRSGDVPVGVPSNMVQYAALALMLEHLTGFEAAAYYHTISDAHIYEDQLDAVETMLDREPPPAADRPPQHAGRR